MLKLIYLAKRKPAFTVDEFVCRWRKHGALAMEQRLWRHTLGYVQAEPIRPSPVAGTTEEYDAVACYMIRDEIFSAMDEQDIASAMRIAGDELETFSCPIPEVSLWVTEERIKAGELGGITAFLFFSDAGAARETANRACNARQFNRITLNLRADVVLGPAMNTLPYAAVVELSASSVPDLATAAGTTEAGLLATAEVTVITREAVLWNRLV